MAVLGYFEKLEKGLGLAFGEQFRHDNTVSMNKVSMSYFFPSQDIKQNVLLSSYLDNWWRQEL